MGEYKSKLTDDGKALLVMLFLFFVVGFVIGMAIAVGAGVIA